MLKNIKSVYYIRILFSHLNEKVKLGLIKYNKNFQKILDIELINYKFYSGLYIIYEKDNKIGKLYDGYEDHLLYEGEFLHGKKNGKGKEIAYMGNILFEGEYLNGKINGKGKEYYDDGKVKFEGNYLNGCRHGEGIQYYNNDKVRFEGEYLNDRIWNGKIYDLYSKKYFEIKNGAGYIKDYDCTGKILVSEGYYYNGERHGQQKDYYENGKILFEGQYLNGSPNGHGKKYEMNGQLRFEGEYINGIAWNGIQYDYDNNTTYNIRNGKYVNNEEEKEKENESNEQSDDVISLNMNMNAVEKKKWQYSKRI